MTAIKSALSSSSPSFKSNADAMQNLVEELNGRLATAALGGDERSRKRHTERGKLLPRARIEALLDNHVRLTGPRRDPAATCPAPSSPSP